MVMQQLRDGAQGIAAKVVMALLVFVLAAFGFGSFNLFQVSEPAVATVNGEDITQRELDGEVARQKELYRAQLGPQATDALLDQIVTPAGMLETLIDRELLEQASSDLDLEISTAAINSRMRDLVAGVEDLDEATFRSRLAAMGFTPAAFQLEVATTQRMNQLTTGFRETSFMTERELRRAAEIVAQRRDIAYLGFPLDRFSDDVLVDDDAIADHYASFIENYMAEETFDFEFVRLRLEDLEGEIEITDDLLSARYEDRREDMLASPRRRASHILLLASDDGDLTVARTRASEIRDAVMAGEDFAGFARAESADSGSGENGGDLGFSARDDFVPEFADALWALDVGQISLPVETQFGIHLIRLDEVETVEIPPFSELEDELVVEIRQEESRALFNDRLREMDELAFEASNSLDELVESFGLAIERLEGVTRFSIEGVLVDPRVRDAFLADDVINGGFNSQAIASNADEVLVGRLANRQPASEKPLIEVRDEIRERLVAEQTIALSRRAADAALDDLVGGSSPTDVATRANTDWDRLEGTPRQNDEVDDAILATGFALEASTDDRAAEVAQLADGSSVLVLLTAARLGDYSAMTEADRTSLSTQVSQMATSRSYMSLINALRQDASLDRVNFTDEGE